MNQAPSITIRLLHERRAGSGIRKIDGVSGKLYVFHWDGTHRAYCYTTSEKAEIDDIFESQGRSLACYFAPVIPTPPAPEPIPGHVALMLLKHEIDLPARHDQASVAQALVDAFERGVKEGSIAAVLKPQEPAPTPAPSEPIPPQSTAPEAEPAQSPSTEKIPPAAPKRGGKKQAPAQ